MPKFTLDTIEDAYAYYVRILEIPESVFWNSMISELKTIADDKAAYEMWLTSALEKERKRNS